jgi:hypothetical protein
MASGPQYNFEYWLNELVECGKKIEPEKYTRDYVAHMRRQWLCVPFTKLHKKVLERRSELLSIK